MGMFLSRLEFQVLSQFCEICHVPWKSLPFLQNQSACKKFMSKYKGIVFPKRMLIFTKILSLWHFSVFFCRGKPDVFNSSGTQRDTQMLNVISNGISYVFILC